jgi:light-regulated signal transduction histidine kinase (bacteriophytochrome)
VDLSRLATEIAAELREGNGARAVDVSIEPGLTTQGDPQLLRVALHNLLDNAWKYTGKTPEARIEFGAMRRNDETVYFVRDNGAGFDMQYAGKLFGAFQRLHTEREFTGTGIGLATVARIVHRHGGQIWAEGAPGAGATFYFILAGPPQLRRKTAPRTGRQSASPQHQCSPG